MTADGSPRVSIVVPSWTGEVTRLMDSIAEQTFRDYEVEVVRGVSPAAKARNVGVERTAGSILVFIDDDAYLGDPEVLGRLVAAIDRHPGPVVVGTSKLAPPEASRFKRAVAKQVPRMEYPVLAEDLEDNPPLDSYGFTGISTTCCAMSRADFGNAGGFDESLPTGGEDTDLFHRMRRQGCQMYVAAQTWVYHDPPGDLRDLLRKSYFYGLGHALEAHKDPSRRMDVLHLDTWWGKLLPLVAALGFPIAFVVQIYFEPRPRLRLGVRPLKTLSTYAVLAGYVIGWFRGKPRGRQRSYRGQPPAAT